MRTSRTARSIRKLIEGIRTPHSMGSVLRFSLECRRNRQGTSLTPGSGRTQERCALRLDHLLLQPAFQLFPRVHGKLKEAQACVNIACPCEFRLGGNSHALARQSKVAVSDLWFGKGSSRQSAMPPSLILEASTRLCVPSGNSTVTLISTGCRKYRRRSRSMSPSAAVKQREAFKSEIDVTVEFPDGTQRRVLASN